MEFKKLPLFGPDSSPQNTSLILSLIGTFIFWVIFLICMIFINPVKNEQKFNEVKIILEEFESKNEITESEEQQKKQNIMEENVKNQKEVIQTVQEIQQKIPQVQNIQQIQKNHEVQKKSENQEIKNSIKTEIQKKSYEPYKYENFASDPMDAFNQQTSTKKQNKEFNWEQFDEIQNQTINSTENSSQKIVENQNEIFGSVGQIVKNQNEKITSKISQIEDFSKQNDEKSVEIQKALQDIEKIKFIGISDEQIKSETTVKTKQNSSGNLMMEMADGSSRMLINPKEPKINLSKEATALIDSSKTVKISFRIIEAGNVPSLEIKITPESILPVLVRKEISEQISKWIFEPSNKYSNATFEYRILTK